MTNIMEVNTANETDYRLLSFDYSCFYGAFSTL